MANEGINVTRKTDEISVIVKTYDFTVWLLPHVAKFSRDHRFTLGKRLEEGVLEVLELLVDASYAGQKNWLLQQANSRLNRVRYLVRLAKDLRQLSMKQYEFAARALDAIGMEIGGWLKQQDGHRRPHETRDPAV